VTDRSTAETVTIIGARIGGLYLLAQLGTAGFKLRVHDIDDSKFAEIRARGGVDVEGQGSPCAVVLPIAAEVHHFHSPLEEAEFEPSVPAEASLSGVELTRNWSCWQQMRVGSGFRSESLDPAISRL
jgi:hypothetical protein